MNVTVPTLYGPCQVNVIAHTQSFFIHPQVVQNESTKELSYSSCWSVTHKLSLRQIAAFCKPLKALECACELEQLTDWTRDGRDLANDEMLTSHAHRIGEKHGQVYPTWPKIMAEKFETWKMEVKVK